MKKKTNDQTPTESNEQDVPVTTDREFFVPSVGHTIIADSIEGVYEQLNKEEEGDGNK